MHPVRLDYGGPIAFRSIASSGSITGIWSTIGYKQIARFANQAAVDRLGQPFAGRIDQATSVDSPIDPLDQLRISPVQLAAILRTAKDFQQLIANHVRWSLDCAYSKQPVF